MDVDSDTQSSVSCSAETIVGFEDIIDRLRLLEDRLAELEGLQKQDADEAVGMMGSLNESVEELEEAVEKLENQVDHHKHLFQRYRIADLFQQM